MAELFDILVRHQVYLEGLKKGATADFPKLIVSVDREIRSRLAHIDYKTLSDATKGELAALLVSLREAMRKLFNPYISRLVDFLQRFMQVEVEAFNAYFSADADPDTAFASSKTQPMGANGLFWLPFLRGSATYTMVRIERLITAGYANGLSKDEVARQLLGTKANNYRDGIAGQLDAANRAAFNTVVQHLSAQASLTAAGRSALAMLRADAGKYRWVSVLDDNTTKICRSRSGNVYEYGRGPMPPAHVGCRSTTVPLYEGMPTEEPPFDMWASKQSADFINDAFDGKVPARYEGSAPLTLAQYKGKRAIIFS